MRKIEEGKRGGKQSGIEMKCQLWRRANDEKESCKTFIWRKRITLNRGARRKEIQTTTFEWLPLSLLRKWFARKLFSQHFISHFCRVSRFWCCFVFPLFPFHRLVASRHVRKFAYHNIFMGIPRAFSSYTGKHSLLFLTRRCVFFFSFFFGLLHRDYFPWYTWILYAMSFPCNLLFTTCSAAHRNSAWADGEDREGITDNEIHSLWWLWLIVAPFLLLCTPLGMKL